jgi:uncharacterized protein
VYVVKKSDLYKTIPYSIRKAQSFGTRLKGLMFRKQPLHEEGLWIAPCNSIHMCFMHFPIDAVFLDQHHRVVHLVENLKPWKFVFPIKQAHSVLELPPGTISKFHIEVGQYVNWM